jgi:SAM-dependent methyltransferase
VSLRVLWDAEAERWARFARTAGHDRHYALVNLPAFLELLPRPGRATLDLGCGEGRVGAELAALGHRVVGVDASPTLVAHARERHAAVLADAAALPFPDAEFDLVTAFMSLHDMDDAAGAIREAGRVLDPRGRFCIALEHPLNVCGTWEREAGDAPLVVEDMLSSRRYSFTAERDGIEVTFNSEYRPLSWYAERLAEAGLLIEALREPAASAAFVAGEARRTRWQRLPLFLHVRAVKP